ncbi:MAG: DUF58 domain-containing protein [Candidatus Sumerlaeota bacterium]|nr:DUF58 domain-containing protein [Candidatus Sumerlaeota bacterium]
MDRDFIIPLFTKRNGLAVAAGLALFFGVEDGNRSLIALAILFTAFLATGWWFARGLLDRFQAERRHSPRCLEDESLWVELRLWNEGRKPALMLEVEDQFEPALRSRVRALIPEPVAANEEATLSYRRACERRRGLYVLGPLRLRAADPLGLFPREREMEAFSQLRVVPRAARLKRFDVLGRGTHFGVGVETAGRPGPGEEFLELRDYRRGDSPRLIHWPSSARLGRMVVKELNVNVSTEVAIFLDMTRLAHTGVGDVTSAEWAIKACVSIAEAAIARQHRVGLFLVGKEIEEIPFGGGPVQFNQILDGLTLARVGGEGRFHEEAVRRLGRIRRGATAVFIVTATRVDPEGMESLLRHLWLEGRKTIVVLVDDRTFLKIWGEQERQQTEAPALRDLARRFALVGARVYRIAKDDDPRQRLERTDIEF